jgi:hypothetical protein
MCHPILILREKGMGNVFLLVGNANVPPNSDSKSKVNAYLLAGNPNVLPNSHSTKKARTMILSWLGMPMCRPILIL